MKKPVPILVLLVLLAGAVPSLADGKFYWPEEVPPGIPYQRAMLLYDGARETLVLQSKYEAPDAEPDAALGWVVPVPAVPELASMEPWAATRWFSYASEASQPKVTRLSEIAPAITLLLIYTGAVLTLVVCLLSFWMPRLRFVRQHRAALATAALLPLLPLLGTVGLVRARLPMWLHTGLFLLGPACALLVLLVCLLSLFVPRLRFLRGQRAILVVGGLLGLVTIYPYWTFLSVRAGGESEGLSGVEVIQANQVGIYDVQVVRAEKAGDLVDWLNQHQFHFDVADTQAFDGYVHGGWCFVVARIDPALGADEGRVAQEGLVAPLILRFEAEAPVYPLALTATADQETEILLYLFSYGKWTSDGRLELQYAGRAGNLAGFGSRASSEIQPAGFFSAAERGLPYLCKFKGRLTPEQMRNDLTFRPAGDDTPYRKRLVIW